jgi:hypothetical protein
MSGVARLAPSSQSGGVPSKLSRPECGTVAGIGDPAGCEVSRGSPAGKRAHLGSASAEKLLTEEPSCEVGHMAAPTSVVEALKKPLPMEGRPHRVDWTKSIHGEWWKAFSVSRVRALDAMT